MTPRDSLETILSPAAKGKTCTLIPGSYDRLSARLVQGEGFLATSLPGGSIEVSHFGSAETDNGSAGYEFLTQAVSSSIDIPLLVDGEDGLGDPEGTVSSLSNAGAAGVHIEDRHRIDGTLTPSAEFADAIPRLVRAAADGGAILVARTDGLRTSENDALERGRAYAGSGAPAVLPYLGPLLADRSSRRQLLEFLASFAQAVPVPIVAYAPLGYELSTQECVECGVQVLLVPHLALAAAGSSVSGALRTLRDAPSRLAGMSESDALWSLEHLRRI